MLSIRAKVTSVNTDADSEQVTVWLQSSDPHFSANYKCEWEDAPQTGAMVEVEVIV